MLLVQVVIPYIGQKFLRRLEQTLQFSTFQNSQIKDIILALVPLLKQFINGMCLVFNTLEINYYVTE